MMPSTVAWPELLWTSVAVIGFAINIWAVADATADLHYLQASGLNGAREIVARANIRSDAINVIIQLIMLCIGAFAMSQPPANPDRPVTPGGIVVAGGLICIAVLLVLKSALNRRDRHRTIVVLAKELASIPEGRTP